MADPFDYDGGHFDEAHRATLEAFLAADRPGPTLRSLPGIDGFLTGLAAGPASLVEMDWTDDLWGGVYPAFGSEAEEREINQILILRLKEIALQLRISPEAVQPLFDADEVPGVDKADATDWATGFHDAMRLDPDAWLPLFEDEALRYLIAALTSLVPGTPVHEDRIARRGPLPLGGDIVSELIPAIAYNCAAFWRKHKAGSRPRRRVAKVGRSAPCPCGSGRKYKRCCGAG